MTLKNYIKHLQKIEKKHPNLKVLIDYNGCGSCKPANIPQIGNHLSYEFVSESQFEDFIVDREIPKTNSICLNY